MNWEAIILSGGKAERLSGVDKALLVGVDGRTCLERTLDACVEASKCVIVGPRIDGYCFGGDSPTGDSSDANSERIVWTREDPPYSGPARAIAAGMAALTESSVTDVAGDVWVVVLACDMPFADQAIPDLLQAARNVGGPFVDGIAAFGQGHRQWLCAVYRKSSLAKACQRMVPGGSGESVKWLIQDLLIMDCPVESTATEDIDTPAQMRALGFRQAERISDPDSGDMT